MCEHIASVVTAVGFKQTASVQQRYDLFKVFFGYILAFSNILQRDETFFLVEREVIQHTQSISAFC
jgi:hypothetical protein